MSLINARPQNQVLRQSQGKRTLSKVIELAFFPGVGPLTFVNFEFTNPLSRLNFEVEVWYEPIGFNESVLNPPPPAAPWNGYNATGNNAWQIVARAEGNNGGSRLLNRVDPAPNVVGSAYAGAFEYLPRSYEGASSVKFIRVFTVLTTGLTAAFVDVPGRWYARVRWEPNTDITDEELNQAFSDCNLYLVPS